MVCQLVILLLAAVVLCVVGQTREEILRGTEKMRKLSNYNVCGKSIVGFGSRIIEGKPVKLGAYPWMVVIRYEDKHSSDLHWLCGGSLISEQYVITAAHCVHPETIGDFKVHSIRLGELDLNENIADGATPMDFGVELITYHEAYNDRSKVNDIALIKMDKAVTFTDYIRPICLPPPEFMTRMFVGFYPVVIGWGISVNNSRVRTDTRLLEAEIVIQNTDSCRENVTNTRALANAIVDDKVICASSAKSDSCQGDSGGPMMFHRIPKHMPSTSSGNMFLMGIVSYGYHCARPGYPGVYTRVSQHMAWIMNNLDI